MPLLEQPAVFIQTGPDTGNFPSCAFGPVKGQEDTRDTRLSSSSKWTGSTQYALPRRSVSAIFLGQGKKNSSDAGRLTTCQSWSSQRSSQQGQPKRANFPFFLVPAEERGSPRRAGEGRRPWRERTKRRLAGVRRGTDSRGRSSWHRRLLRVRSRERTNEVATLPLNSADRDRSINPTPPSGSTGPVACGVRWYKSVGLEKKKKKCSVATLATNHWLRVYLTDGSAPPGGFAQHHGLIRRVSHASSTARASLRARWHHLIIVGQVNPTQREKRDLPGLPTT